MKLFSKFYISRERIRQVSFSTICFQTCLRLKRTFTVNFWLLQSFKRGPSKNLFVNSKFRRSDKRGAKAQGCFGVYFENNLRWTPRGQPKATFGFFRFSNGGLEPKLFMFRAENSMDRLFRARKCGRNREYSSGLVSRGRQARGGRDWKKC